MTWPYRLTRAARRDLEEVADYWTERVGPDVALKVIGEIIETILRLSQQPRMGRIVEEFGPGVRRFPSGRYVIYYRVARSRVQILHVFHGSRDQETAWKP
jgi:toxin ParE1/3/4